MAKRKEFVRHYCHLCGKNGACDPLERHHVFEGRNRNNSEKYGAVVYLCGHECHREGKDSVHRNRFVSLTLKEEFQRKIMKEQNWTVEDFIEVFGRSYI